MSYLVFHVVTNAPTTTQSKTTYLCFKDRRGHMEELYGVWSTCQLVAVSVRYIWSVLGSLCSHTQAVSVRDQLHLTPLWNSAKLTLPLYLCPCYLYYCLSEGKESLLDVLTRLYSTEVYANQVWYLLSNTDYDQDPTCTQSLICKLCFAFQPRGVAGVETVPFYSN